MTTRRTPREPPATVSPAASSRSASRQAPSRRDALALAALLAAAGLLLAAAGWARAPLTFDAGPSTGRYLAGFTDSEERPPLTFRWSRREARVALPLSAGAAPGRLTLRAARFLDEPALVEVLVSGRPAGTFEARPGGFKLHRLAVSVPPGPLSLELRATSPGGEDLGVALDWVQLEGVPLRVGLAFPLLLVGGVFVLARATGFPLRTAAALAALAALLAALGAALDPFGAAHVAAHLVVPGLALAAACAWALRGRERGRVVVMVFLAGYLVKGAGVFHPRAFYPDVRLFGRYTRELAQAEGTLAERSQQAQVRTNTAYPRYVAGKAYAFPYSPVFFLPFTALPPERALVEDALKHVALAAAALEVVAVFVFAGIVAGSAVGVAAAAVAAALPPLFSRLLLAMWATLAGHLLDLAVVIAALLLAARPQSPRRALGLLTATLLALFTYISSLFNVGGFLGILGLLEGRRGLRLLALAAGAALTVVVCLYLPFALVFFEEILPAALRGEAKAASEASAAAALGRIPIFFGYAYPLLTAAGLVLVRRRATREAWRVVAAYGLTFALLVALRAFGGGLFKDLKEVEFVGPLVALGTGAVLVDLAGRGTAGRWAAALTGIGLLAFGLGRYAEYLGPRTALLAWPP
jgi:hypothetical protein